MPSKGKLSSTLTPSSHHCTSPHGYLSSDIAFSHLPRFNWKNLPTRISLSLWSPRCLSKAKHSLHRSRMLCTSQSILGWQVHSTCQVWSTLFSHALLCSLHRIHLFHERLIPNITPIGMVGGLLLGILLWQRLNLHITSSYIVKIRPNCTNKL